MDEPVAQRPARAVERHGLIFAAWLDPAAGRALVIEEGLIVGAPARGDLTVSSDPRDLNRLGDAIRVTIRLKII